MSVHSVKGDSRTLHRAAAAVNSVFLKAGAAAPAIFFTPVRALANGRVIPVRKTDHQWPFQYNRYISNKISALVLFCGPNISGADALPRSGCIFAFTCGEKYF